MRTIQILALWLLMCLFVSHPLNAQITSCGPEVAIDTGAYAGSAFFNYGSTARIKSNTYRTATAVGQTFTGYTENVTRNSTLGFYSRYFLPPFALKVKATQGDLLDRILVSWEVDQLGPTASKGFVVFRDGNRIFETDDPSARNYPDMNVVAGRAYSYCVQARNDFGEGVCTDAIGFLVPNGIATGSISTINGTPVPDAEVILTPLPGYQDVPQGFSAKFDQGDGAFIMQDSTTTPFLPALDQNWTIAFWIKTDMNTNGRILGMDSLYIRPRPSANGGIAIAKTAGGTAFLIKEFTNNTPNEWHHVALTYDGLGNKYQLYIDGQLGAIATSNPVPPPDTILFGALANVGNGNQIWKGRLDEFRIYDRKLDELDFGMVMDGTASKQTPNLTHYWKFDEELGVKSYDIINRDKMYLCGARFDADRSPVYTAGISTEDGYYTIESAYYGDGVSFSATPKKNFYLHRALKFEKTENDYATIPDFSITNQATIETWVNSAGVDGFQTILSKQWGTNEFRLMMAPSGTDNQVRVYMNGTVHDYGVLGSGYHLLTMTWDSLTRKAVVYKDSTSLGSFTFPNSVTGNWSDPEKPWYLGKRFDGTQPFGGLIDEVAVYDTILTPDIIKGHARKTRIIQESGLRVYFPLDEGSGNKINNVGSVLLAGGTTSGTEWSPLAPHQVITPHSFSPSSRVVTLTPSNTSVDGVDFTDRSTIGVSGYVRYKGTDCFARNVEILVNGESFHPQIFTDTTGKFVIDFDPGTSAILTPKFEDHVFVPGFWEVTNVSSPIAGILFTDMTTRSISGIIAGNEICKKPIIANPPGTNADTRCRVQVRSVDGCLEREILVTNQDGEYEFEDLPPLERMTVSIVEFSDQTIKTAFDVQGGYTLDISKKDTSDIDFIYTAPPKVEIANGLDTVPDCSPTIIVLEEGFYEVVKIKPYEQYELTYDPMDEDQIIDDGVCYIDTADLHIINGIAEEEIDTLIDHGILIDTFIVGDPNPTPPYLKNFQVVVKNEKGQEGSLTRQVIVTGIKNKLETFTTLLPEIPSVILRDPPGDGSYSYLEKEKKVCQQYEMSDEVETGGGVDVQVLLGPDLTTIEAPLGVGIITTNDNVNNLSFDTEGTVRKLNSHSFETCMSFSSRIATSDDDLIVGGERGGDVYMGSALNIIYGFADQVTYNFTTCEVEVDTIINVEPGDFATTFIYSEFYITGFLIPSLTILYDDDTADPVDTARYGQSIRRWEAILENNRKQKEDAIISKNISFDAGTEYEYSETSDTTSSEVHENFTNTAFLFTGDVGLTIDGFGFITSPKIIVNTSNGGRDETETAQGVTTGYVLKDDDPGDAFSVDVGMDDVYKTPVFNLKAGQSNCPWEPGTANREATNMHLADGYSNEVINVPSNEAATFKLVLGNLSATNEQWTYFLTSIGERNPDGAIIKYNGQVLNYLQDFIIPFGESREATITIERGPEKYEYDNLLVAQLSACEYERNLALSLDIEEDEKFFSGVELSVHFIRPCSEVTMNVPEQNWVVDKNGSPDLPITVTGYDLSNTDFQLIRVQYRRSDGDGTWINLPQPYLSAKYNPNWSGYTNQSALGPAFTQFLFNTTGLEDGDYELHAWAVCTGTAADKPGFSQIIKGRIDRKPPRLVGIPEPSDGVLQVGDEISFTFNKPINCNQLWAGTVIDHVNVYNTRTNTLVPSKVECGDNKIVIDSLAQNEFIENEILRVDLDSISDLTGNVLVHTDWEFYVDRNELAWLTDSAGITKYPDQTKSVTLKIHNRGGYPVPFTIDSIPDWLNVSPDAGTLVANEIRDITFTAPDTMELGWFKDSIVLHTETGLNPFFMGGDEALPFDVRNICRPPDWDIDPTLYQMSMTLVARFQFDTTPPVGDNYITSIDPEDQVAAFINGELRGTAKLVKYVGSVYLAYVTIYGNVSDIGDSLTFELFNASECKHYPATFGSGGSITFIADNVQGSPAAPRFLRNYGPLLSDVPLQKGWNWISFNLGFPDPSINQALHNIPNAAGDLIKDQTQFAVFNNETWTGSLTQVGNTSAYFYQAAKPNNIKIIGDELDPALVHIPIIKGTNWIGYIPTYSLPVTAALATLHPKAGDIIKGQDAFAQYVSPANGWVGNLKTMESLHGYVLKIDTAGTLTYPGPQPFTGEEHHQSRSAESLTSFWNVDASQYEFNMTLIGIFQYEGINATAEGMELGAFVGDELRGVGEAVYVEYLDAYVFFMTSFANKSGEQMHFKLYDNNTGEIQELSEKMTFAANAFEGTIEEPVPFTLQTTGLGELQSELSLNVQPNPFRDETVCLFELPFAEDVHLIITDMQGKNVYFKSLQANAGMNRFTWKGCATNGAMLTKGIYFIRMETEQGVLTKKVVLQR